jgi:hypothetical protein
MLFRLLGEWFGSCVDSLIERGPDLRVSNWKEAKPLSLHITRRVVISNIAAAALRYPVQRHRTRQRQSRAPGVPAICGDNEFQIELARGVGATGLSIRVVGKEEMCCVAAGIGIGGEPRCEVVNGAGYRVESESAPARST